MRSRATTPAPSPTTSSPQPPHRPGDREGQGQPAQVRKPGLLSLCLSSPPPFPPTLRLSSPKYSPLGGWLMSCTSFLVSLSSSSSGGWLRETWKMRIRGSALPLALDAVKIPEGDQAIPPKKVLAEEHVIPGPRGMSRASVPLQPPTSYFS